MEIQTKKQAKEYFAQMLKDNGGKAFIGMSHPIYGPVRGLNFILENAKSKEVFGLIDEALELQTQEEQMKIMKMLENGTPPSNIRELISKIWAETGMATAPQILPFELVEQAENTPETVPSISEGIKKISQTLRLTAPLQKQDAFFFRVGII
jgi:hypothetical protein